MCFKLPIGAVGSIVNAKNGFINFRGSSILALSSLISMLIVSRQAQHIDGDYLKKLFSICLGLSAIRMLR